MSDKKATDEPKRWLDHSENKGRFLRWFYWACGLIIAADVVFSIFWHKHATFSDGSSLESPEALPVFYGLYGFLACGGLILAAKELRKFVMRKEDYYD